VERDLGKGFEGLIPCPLQGFTGYGKIASHRGNVPLTFPAMLSLTRESADIYTYLRFRVRRAESGEGKRCAGKVIVGFDDWLGRSIGR
jgi:hypothetical protein